MDSIPVGSAMDLTGARVGRLTVISRSPKAATNHGGASWNCQCDCGNTSVVRASSLRKGAKGLKGGVQSCGCGQSQVCRELAYKWIEKRGCVGGVTREVNGYKKNCEKRGFTWDLTYQEALDLLTSDCVYCGQAPTKPTQSKRLNKVEKIGGIDRVDNNKGYTPDNSVSCCETCNRAKLKMTRGEFLDWANRVVEHQRNMGNINLSAVAESELRWAVQ